MKTKLLIIALALPLVFGCRKFDDSHLWNSINNLNSRVERLEDLCDRMNANISSLQVIVQALQTNDAIKSVTSLPNGEGYAIIFASGKSINIYNGTNGVDGKDGVDGKPGEDGENGVTPIISVKKDSDGVYYWTVNGDWLIVDGHKVKAVGTDGSNGHAGIDGTNGEDGITPQFKIEDGYWYISYDNEQSWEKLGKATGDNGIDANYIIKDVSQDDSFVYFLLADDETIIIAKKNFADSDYITFEDINVKCILLQNFDVNHDGQLSYEEAANIKSLGTIFKEQKDIKLFHELKYFTGLTTIDESAFYSCKNLLAVTIPSNVVVIGTGAFEFCSNLCAVGFAKNALLKQIGERAFSWSGLMGIDLPNNLIQIGEKAFEYTKLESIYLPNSLMTLGAGAFAKNSNLETVSFAKGSKLSTIIGGKLNNSGNAIVDGTFYNCSRLKEITLPASVSYIGEGAFFGCSSLRKVSFEENSMLSYIGDRAFGASGANDGNLPIIFNASTCSKLLSLSSYLFCRVGAFVCCSEVPPQINSKTFVFLYYDSGRCERKLQPGMKLYVPANSLETYRNADYWKEIGTILPIEEYKEE